MKLILSTTIQFSKNYFLINIKTGQILSSFFNSYINLPPNMLLCSLSSHTPPWGFFDES